MSSVFRTTHVESYEDLARHVDGVTEMFMGTLTSAQLQSKQEQLRLYKEQLGSILQTHRDHVERLEGIERNADIQLSRLSSAIQYREIEEREARAEEERQVARRVNAAALRTSAEQARIANAVQALPSASVHSHALTPLDDFVESMRAQNAHQAEILQRIKPSFCANREIFLSSYTPNTDTAARRRHIEGEFSVLGTVRNGVRDAYTVTWYKQGQNAKSFWCSCPDQRFNGGKKDIYCKHISFLVCRMARILDAQLFRTKQFTPDMHALFAERIRAAPTLWVSAATASAAAPEPAYTITTPTVRNEAFKTGGKPLEAGDSCPICYDEFGEQVHLSCPTCKNNMHQECMEVWLERNNTCVFCRSNVWRAYRR